jgi:uncharacterized membrane protein
MNNTFIVMLVISIITTIAFIVQLILKPDILTVSVAGLATIYVWTQCISTYGNNR